MHYEDLRIDPRVHSEPIYRRSPNLMVVRVVADPIIAFPHEAADLAIWCVLALAGVRGFGEGFAGAPVSSQPLLIHTTERSRGIQLPTDTATKTLLELRNAVLVQSWMPIGQQFSCVMKVSK